MVDPYWSRRSKQYQYRTQSESIMQPTYATHPNTGVKRPNGLTWTTGFIRLKHVSSL